MAMRYLPSPESTRETQPCAAYGSHDDRGLSAEALEPMPMTPEQFGEYIRTDIAKWERVAKARKIEIE